MKMIEIKCATCDNVYLKKEKHIKYKLSKGQSQFYCSKKCHGISQRSKVVTKICLFCKKSFLSTTYCDAPDCCSKRCAARYSQSFADPNVTSQKTKEAWANGSFNDRSEKIKKYKLCSVCGTKFYGNKIYCSLQCLKNSNHNEKISAARKKMFENNQLKVTGGTTKWLKYKNIKVQGSYEYRTCTVLDKWKTNGKIKQWKYSPERFQYVGLDGKNHNYLVDFKVWNNDDTFYYLEVKGYQKENDKLKWDAVKKMGHSLTVWFNPDITKEENNLSHRT